jgi:hypothetical protein
LAGAFFAGAFFAGAFLATAIRVSRSTRTSASSWR